jgi:peptidoglycan/xylan/chitin deacetylase (PgdA/CDA1 family)
METGLYRNEEKKEINIISSWDDGNREDLRLAELLLKYKIPSIFFIPGNCELSNEEIIELSKNFEIGSHTMSHAFLTRINHEDRMYELEKSKEILEDIIKKPVTKFCFPRGYYNDEVLLDVESVYENARTVDVFNTKDEGFLIRPTIHISYPFRKEYEGKDLLELSFNYLDKVLDEGGVYHFWGHSSELSKTKTWETLEQLLKYINMRLKNANIHSR